LQDAELEVLKEWEEIHQQASLQQLRQQMEKIPTRSPVQKAYLAKAQEILAAWKNTQQRHSGKRMGFINNEVEKQFSDPEMTIIPVGGR